jgi:hypothetical protein
MLFDMLVGVLVDMLLVFGGGSMQRVHVRTGS